MSESSNERLPDGIMLDDFERLLDLENDPDGPPTEVILLELCRFMDEHGRRLLLLARTCHTAMVRQSKVPQ